MSLIARHLEENGIPTVVIGSAKDIVEYTAVARFVFTDFPLGNPAGLPGQAEMQKAIVAQALPRKPPKPPRSSGTATPAGARSTTGSPRKTPSICARKAKPAAA